MQAAVTKETRPLQDFGTMTGELEESEPTQNPKEGERKRGVMMSSSENDTTKVIQLVSVAD